MENRLCLNKKPVYKLPDEVEVVNYNIQKNRSRNKGFKADVSINANYKIYASKGQHLTNNQILIKTQNLELINFILQYDFSEVRKSNVTNKSMLRVNDVKKIILEEFYGVKYGE